MAQQTINVGAAPNDGTGTPLRTAFQYTNSNFTELYTALGGGSGLPGASTQVIFNDGGTNLAGSAGLVFNKTTSVLGVGTVNAGAAIVSGDLTVDTNTLKVDSANNRVGVGTASPTAGMALDIVSATSNNFVRFTDGVNATGYLGVRAANGAVYLHANNNIVSLSCSTSNTTPTEQLRITNPGVFEFLDGAGGARMTLNATGLGVGVTPLGRLHVRQSGAGIQDVGLLENAQAAAADVGPRLGLLGVGSVAMATVESGWNGAANTDAYLSFRTRGSGAVTERLRIDSSGNVGIGVASPATKLDVAGNARVQLAFFTGGTIPGLTNDNPFAYRFPGGGLGLGAATETGTASPIIFYTGQGGVERVRVKGFGQVRFFPLAADPAGAEAGDVYYNSTSNKLKCYNGTTWNDLF